MQYYAVVVDAVDKQAGTDASVCAVAVQGVAQLDAAHNMPWYRPQRGRRDAVLRGIEKAEFFAAIRTETISSLYDNPVVYRCSALGAPRSSTAATSTGASTTSAGCPMRDREERPMAKTFDLKDDTSVIVVIGSGAGGGTLSNELAQRGIDVVCLEAGPRLELSDIVNDNGTMFGRLSWLDKRIGTGDAQSRAAALGLQDGRWHDGALGGRRVALPGTRVPRPLGLWRRPRREPARLAA